MSSLITDAITTAATGTAAQFTSEDVVLLAGEWGYETDTGKAKQGDGSTAWTSLSYSADPTFQTQIDAKVTGSTDQLCKAWVNFNGTGTVAIRDSYNVTSITDNGTGDYTVNFTNAMNNANYTLGGSTGQGNVYISENSSSPDKTVNHVRISTSLGTTAAVFDTSIVSIQIFGT